MSKKRLIRAWFGDKFDGVVEAVRYKKTGRIEWVRAYERRGPTWSDHFMIERPELLKRLQAGQRFYTGERVLYNASEFNLGEKIIVDDDGKGEVIITKGTKQNLIDHLNGVEIL